jgi:hypothetical protein
MRRVAGTTGNAYIFFMHFARQRRNSEETFYTGMSGFPRRFLMSFLVPCLSSLQRTR